MHACTATPLSHCMHPRPNSPPRVDYVDTHAPHHNHRAGRNRHTTVICTRCMLGMYGCTHRERTCPAQHCQWNVLYVLHCSLLAMHDQMLISSVAISLGVRERMLHSSFLPAPPAYQACCSAGLIAHYTHASASTHSALASHMCSCARTLRTHHSRPCRP